MRTMFVLLSAMTLTFAACSGDGDDKTGTDDSGPTAGDDDDTSDPVDAILALTGDSAAGMTIYSDNCSICHGDSGEGGTGDPLDVAIPAETIVETVYYGEGIMAAYSETLSDQEIADVAAYVQTLAQ